MSIDTILTCLGFAAMAIGLGFTIWLIVGFTEQCPKCKKLHAEIPVATHQTGQSITARVESFSENIYNVKGEVIGQNNWTEQRQYLVTDFLNDHRCKFYSHTWSTTSQSETPNFTKDL